MHLDLVSFRLLPGQTQPLPLTLQSRLEPACEGLFHVISALFCLKREDQP